MAYTQSLEDIINRMIISGPITGGLEASGVLPTSGIELPPTRKAGLAYDEARRKGIGVAGAAGAASRPLVDPLLALPGQAGEFGMGAVRRGIVDPLVATGTAIGEFSAGFAGGGEPLPTPPPQPRRALPSFEGAVADVAATGQTPGALLSPVAGPGPVTTGRVDYSPNALLTPEERFQRSPVTVGAGAQPTISGRQGLELGEVRYRGTARTPSEGALGPRSGGVTFNTPTDARSSPIIAQYERLQSQKRADEQDRINAVRENFINNALLRTGEQTGNTGLGMVLANRANLSAALNLAKTTAGERAAGATAAAGERGNLARAQAAYLGSLAGAQGRVRAAELGVEGQRVGGEARIGAAEAGAAGRVAAARATSAGRLPTTDQLISNMLQSDDPTTRAAGAGLYTQRYGQAPQVTAVPSLPGQEKVVVSGRGATPEVVDVNKQYQEQQRARVTEAAKSLPATAKPGQEVSAGGILFRYGRSGWQPIAQP